MSSVLKRALEFPSNVCALDRMLLILKRKIGCGCCFCGSQFHCIHFRLIRLVKKSSAFQSFSSLHKISLQDYKTRSLASWVLCLFEFSWWLWFSSMTLCIWCLQRLALWDAVNTSFLTWSQICWPIADYRARRWCYFHASMFTGTVRCICVVSGRMVDALTQWKSH